MLSSALVIGMMLPIKHAHPEAKFEIGKVYELSLENTLLHSLSEPDKEKPTQEKPILKWQHFEIKSGESLAILFSRANISPTILHNLINSGSETKSLERLKIGDKISLGFLANGEFTQLKLKKNPKETLVVTRVDDNFISQIDTTIIDTQVNYATSTITSSFWNAGVSAGLDANQIMELANIFAWDIDFALDIREGDRFEVLFEERLKEGEYVGHGNILAATFVNQGETFVAIRAKSGSYYDDQGRAMRKAFLRSPVNFRYVSSNFNPKRLHPVTGQLKAHRGTDYVAPIGTPIWAAGDGVVTKSSYNKFNGNYVFIRHSNTYITKYLHLNRRSVKTGERVKQGETIGTLGKTGRVTGPHLHYEFLVNGQHKNPRTVSFPQATSLTGSEKKEFLALAEQRMQQLTKFSQLFAIVGTPLLGRWS